MGDHACILAVDDDPKAQWFFDRTLQTYGSVVVAGSLADARRKMSAHQWRAIILDRLLDDGSGLDLLPEIHRQFRTTPVLILSGHVDGVVANVADDFDVDVISKPFEAKRLRRWMDRVLGRSPPPDEEPAALREPIASLQHLLAQKPLDLGTRYAIGEIIATLKSDPKQFGNRAVTVVGNAIGQDETSLYRHGRVAERWSREQFDAVATRHMADGRKPSWSHLVLLASLDDDADAELVERTFREPMPVSRLEELVQERVRARY